jgi:glucose-1-phosphate thymidylyltransferase
MDENNSLQYETVTGWWKDTGTPEDILHANQLVLDSIGKENQFVIDKDSTIKDNIVIGKETEVSSNSSIQGPSIIGTNCRVGPNVTLGPNVSVGNNSVLENCKIENSIIMANCEISANVHLSNSIIANGSKIKANIDQTKHELLLGERSQLKI